MSVKFTIISLACLATTCAQIYHMHIPKTAGRSVYRDLWRLAPGFRKGILTKEECHGYGSQRGADLVVTMLRNPRSHIESQYKHCSRSRVPFRPSELPGSFGAWVHAWFNLSKQGWPNQGDVDSVANMPFFCYSPVNLQCHRFTCTERWKPPLVVDSKLAIKHMQDSWFIGITEWYKESMCLLYVRLRSKFPQGCDCRNTSAWAAFKVQSIGASSAYHDPMIGPKKVSEQLLGMINEITSADRALYAAAKERFFTDVHQVEDFFGKKIICGERDSL